MLSPLFLRNLKVEIRFNADFFFLMRFYYAFSLGRQYLCTAPRSRKSVLSYLAIALISRILLTLFYIYVILCVNRCVRN